VVGPVTALLGPIAYQTIEEKHVHLSFPLHFSIRPLYFGGTFETLFETPASQTSSHMECVLWLALYLLHLLAMLGLVLGLGGLVREGMLPGGLGLARAPLLSVQVDAQLPGPGRPSPAVSPPRWLG
jgi:hypothetical protein